MIEDITKEEKFSIRWVIALKDEAEIIIQQYRMKLLSEKSVFPIFKNSEETHWLILSGIGRHNASAATLYLYEKSKAPKWTAWINIGIAGCGEGHFGDLCLVDKITNNSDRKVSFPSAMKNSPFPRMELLTTDIPIIDYSSKELIDMEACAFYDATSKFSSRELISIVKVISDGPSNNIKNLNRSIISKLITTNISNIIKIVLYYKNLSLDEYKRLKKPDIFYKICNQWHFTVSQQHQLERVLRRIATSNIKENILNLLKDCRNSKSVMSILNKQMESYEVDWRNT
jgi:hypothetical protein